MSDADDLKPTPMRPLKEILMCNRCGGIRLVPGNIYDGSADLLCRCNDFAGEAETHKKPRADFVYPPPVYESEPSVPSVVDPLQLPTSNSQLPTPPEPLANLQSALIGKRGLYQKRLAEEVVRVGDLLLRKNADYGASVWKRPRLAPHCDPGSAIMVRMTDKVERLEQLLKKPAEVKEESLADTIRDLAGYCLLWLARPEESE